MREFQYRALAQTGQVVAGMRRAPDAGALARALLAQDLVLLSSRPTLGSFGALFSRAGRAGRKELRDLTQHLATCLGAGIPVIQSLRDFEQDSASKAFCTVLADIRESINSGAQIADALREHAEVFPEIYVAIVEAGQSSGKMDKAFDDLVRYLDWSDDLRNQARQAMTYPAILATAVLGLFLLLLLFVIPRFQGIFGDLGVELPTLTRKVVGAWELLKNGWPVLLVAAAALAIGARLVSRSESGRYQVDRLMLEAPVLGGFVQKLTFSRFCTNFVMLFGAGVDILRVLALLEKVVGNAVLAREIAGVRRSVMTGETLAASFAKAPHFPPLVRRLIAVGERTGSLDTTVAKAAEQLDKELPRALKQLFTFVEVGIVLLLAAMIALAALSLLLPIFSIRSQIVQ